MPVFAALDLSPGSVFLFLVLVGLWYAWYSKQKEKAAERSRPVFLPPPPPAAPPQPAQKPPLEVLKGLLQTWLKK